LKKHIINQHCFTRTNALEFVCTITVLVVVFVVVVVVVMMMMMMMSIITSWVCPGERPTGGGTEVQ